MIVKLKMCGAWTYFRGHDAKWNMLDAFVVVTSLLEIVLRTTASVDITIMSILRILRLFRLTKILRQNTHLKILVTGLVAALRSMMWVALLLILVLYASAILFCTLYAWGSGELEGKPVKSASHWDDAHFGSIVPAMMSLFGVSIGAEWSSVVWPIIEVGGIYWLAVPALLVFIFVTQFGFLNIIIGVIVDNSTKAREEAQGEKVKRQQATERALIAKGINAMGEHAKLTSEGLTLDGFGEFLEAHEELEKLITQGFPPGFRVDDLYRTLQMSLDDILTADEFDVSVEHLLFSTPLQDRLLQMLFRKNIETRLELIQHDIGEIKEMRGRRVVSR